METFFDKLQNKINETRLQAAVKEELEAEIYRMAQKTVTMCKKVLMPYQTKLKELGFNVSTRFNTHYFEFTVRALQGTNFTDIEISIANGTNNLPEFYVKSGNRIVNQGKPQITPELTETVFIEWLETTFNNHFNI